MGSREVGLMAEESLSWSSKKKRKVVRMTPGPLGSQASVGRRCQPGRYNSTAGGPDRNLHPRVHPEALSLQWETGPTDLVGFAVESIRAWRNSSPFEGMNNHKIHSCPVQGPAGARKCRGASPPPSGEMGAQGYCL